MDRIDWGSIADWFAAFGTILAACVALWIAFGERRRRADEEQTKRVAFASYAAGELGHVATMVGDIRERIRQIVTNTRVVTADILTIEALAAYLDAPLTRQNISAAGLFTCDVAKAIGLSVAALDQNTRTIALLKSAASRQLPDHEFVREVESYRLRFIDTQIWLNEAIHGMLVAARLPSAKTGGNWHLSDIEMAYWRANR